MSQQSSTTANPLGTESIDRLIRRFSVPAIISFLVNALYNIVDQIFIGQGIGVIGMAATNITFPLTTICTATGLVFGVGGASNFNLSLGRGDQKGAASIAGNAVSMLAITGTAIGALALIFMNPMLYAFGGTDEIMPYAQPYTLVVALGVPFAIFSTGIGHLIRADGSPTFAMVCVLSGAVFNVIFDPIFLFVFDMGIAGIAWATTLGQILSTIIAIFYLARKFHTVKLARQVFRPRWLYVKSICALGAASFFNQLAMTVVQIVMNNTLRYYGALSAYGSEIPLACVGVVSKVSIVFLGITLGISQGCQPITSFNYGAGNYERVRETYKKAIILTSMVSVLTFILFQLFPRQIISIFGKGTEEYFEFASLYLRVFMVMTFINGVQPVTSNYFTSIGKARMGIIISLTRQVIFLLPMLLILPLFLGIDGVMFAGPVADAAAAVLSIIFIVGEMKNLRHLQQVKLAS